MNEQISMFDIGKKEISITKPIRLGRFQKDNYLMIVI